MKILLALASFFLGNAKILFREPSQALTQQLVLRIRSITILAVTAIGSLALACVGISLLIANIASHLDAERDFQMSGGTFLFLGMTVVFGFVLFWALRKETWIKAISAQESPKTQKNSGALESALALVVMDFLEERKHRRSDRTSHKE